MNTTTNAQGFVYVMWAKGANRIKIGHSFSPKDRLRAIQTGCPFPVEILATWPGSQELERRIHRYLSQFRQVGEWFEVPPFTVGYELFKLTSEWAMNDTLPDKFDLPSSVVIRQCEKPRQFNWKDVLPLTKRGHGWWEVVADGTGYRLKLRWRVGKSKPTFVFSRFGRTEWEQLGRCREKERGRKIERRIFWELMRKGRADIARRLVVGGQV